MNKTIQLFISLIGTMTILGCGNAFEAGDFASRSSQLPTVLRSQTDLIDVSEKLSVQKSAVVDSQSISASSTFSSANSKYSEFQKLGVKAGSRWTALLDNECLKLSASEDFATKLSKQEFDLNSLKQKKVAYSFELDSDLTLQELALKLDESGCAIYMENEQDEVEVVSYNDPHFSAQKHLNEIQSDFAEKIQQTYQGTQDVVVAIIDTGLDLNHEDFDKNKLWRDARGFNGIDFHNNDYNPQDGHSHGTYVASLLAAHTNNNKGVSGVAPSGIRLMPIKVLDDRGRGYSTNVVNGIYYAIENGAHIINLSVGFQKESKVMQKALQAAVDSGVIVVSAAGNSGQQLSNNYFITPAGYAYSQRGHISVGSTNESGALSAFSNFGAGWVEIAAPGTNIMGAVLNNKYETKSGTSASAPLIAGAAALLVHQKINTGQGYTAGDIEDFLLENSIKDAKLTSQILKGHRLNLKNLHDALVAQGPITEPELNEENNNPQDTNPPPQNPQGNPEETKIYLGEINSVNYDANLKAVVIKGWGCRWGTSQSPIITLFYDFKLDEDYMDFPTRSRLPSSAAVEDQCGVQGNFNFEHHLPVAKVTKLAMEGMEISGSVGFTEIDEIGIGNFQLTRSQKFVVPKLPDTVDVEVPVSDGMPVIKGKIESIRYRTDLTKVEVSGWACEVGDPGSAKVYLAALRPVGGYITTDVVQADQTSSAESRQVCQTNSNHGFKAYIGLSSVDTFELEGAQVRLHAYGPFRSAGSELIPNPMNLKVPEITDAQRDTPPPTPQTEIKGAITSIVYNPNTKAVDVMGWACEVGVDGPTKVELLFQLDSGRYSNKYADTTLESSNQVLDACDSGGTHNFKISQNAFVSDAHTLLTDGKLILQLVNGPNGEFKNPINPDAYKIPEIPQLNNQNELMGAVTSVNYNNTRKELIIQGWLCEKGLVGSIKYRLDVFRPELGSRVSLSPKTAQSPSSNTVKNQCEANGRFNFQHVLTRADLDKYQIKPGSHIRMYSYANKEGMPNKMIGKDQNYLVPNY